MRLHWIDGQDVRWFSAPEVKAPPKPPDTTSAEVEAQIAAERARASKRRGRSSTIIAGLYGNTGATQKETLGG